MSTCLTCKRHINDYEFVFCSERCWDAWIDADDDPEEGSCP